MHEMALSQSLLDLIGEHARAASASRVTRVVLEIGVLSHVDPAAMSFCFDSAARGTIAENAILQICEPSGKAYCFTCEKTIQIGARGEACPDCHGYQLLVNGGEEMKLKELEVV